MKEFFEDHAKTIILVVLSAAAIVGISVALGITPKDVFSRTVVYEEKPGETGVGSYSELEEEDKEQLFTDESETPISVRMNAAKGMDHLSFCSISENITSLSPLIFWSLMSLLSCPLGSVCTVFLLL